MSVIYVTNCPEYGLAYAVTVAVFHYVLVARYFHKTNSIPFLTMNIGPKYRHGDPLWRQHVRLRASFHAGRHVLRLQADGEFCILARCFLVFSQSLSMCHQIPNFCNCSGRLLI